MTNLPTIQGDSIYASKDGVQIYESANMDSDKLRNSSNGGVLSYSKGDFLGNYTGVTIGNFYQIETVIRYKFGIFKWGVKNRNFTGFVLKNQITTQSKEDLESEQKKQEEQNLQVQLDKISGSGADENLTASGKIPTTSSNNTFLYVLGGLGLLLGGAYLWFTRKKKPVSEQKLEKTVKK